MKFDIVTTVGRGDHIGSSGGKFAGALFYDYAYSRADFAQFSISGLTPGTTYDLYLFASSGTQEDWNQNSTFMVAGALGAKSTTGADAADFIEGVNYVAFHAVPASSSGHINGCWTRNTSTGPFNGLQTVEAGETAPIPEPAAVVLLALGWLGVRRGRG